MLGIFRIFAAFAFGIIVSSLSALAAERTIVGYASPMTVRPGDAVEFKINSIKGPASYKADLVKIINGDSLSRYGDMFKMRTVDAPFSGSYEGTKQNLNLGSYIEVDPSGGLNALKSFTVGAWIFPTFNLQEYKPPDLENPDPFHPPSLSIAKSIGAQTILSRFDGTTGKGWHLTLDKEFRLTFVIGTGDGKLVAAAKRVPGHVIGDVNLDLAGHVLQGGKACLAHDALEHHASGDHHRYW